MTFFSSPADHFYPIRFMILLTVFELLAVSEEKIFLTLANQKQELPLAAIFVGGMGRNEETLIALFSSKF
jgi:hypothetical protein